MFFSHTWRRYSHVTKKSRQMSTKSMCKHIIQGMQYICLSIHFWNLIFITLDEGTSKRKIRLVSHFESFPFKPKWSHAPIISTLYPQAMSEWDGLRSSLGISMLFRCHSWETCITSMMLYHSLPWRKWQESARRQKWHSG